MLSKWPLVWILLHLLTPIAFLPQSLPFFFTSLIGTALVRLRGRSANIEAEKNEMEVPIHTPIKHSAHFIPVNTTFYIVARLLRCHTWHLMTSILCAIIASHDITWHHMTSTLLHPMCHCIASHYYLTGGTGRTEQTENSKTVPVLVCSIIEEGPVH